jgi:hypothetical protein
MYELRYMECDTMPFAHYDTTHSNLELISFVQPMTHTTSKYEASCRIGICHVVFIYLQFYFKCLVHLVKHVDLTVSYFVLPSSWFGDSDKSILSKLVNTSIIVKHSLETLNHP